MVFPLTQRHRILIPSPKQSAASIIIICYRMKIFLLVVISCVVSAQQSREDAINSIFSTNISSFDDFLKNYDEVTQPPLKSFGALHKCGEGTQQDRFVCVPYYNCDPDNNTVIETPDIDGSKKIDIRIRAGDEDEFKCDHYMEVCCQIPNRTNGGNSNDIPVQPTQPTPPTIPNNTPTSPSVTQPGVVTQRPSQGRAFCGIRNNQGLDFNLVGGTNEALFGEFPWMVTILRKTPSRNQSLSICGGSLIGPGVVLTGAHCVEKVDVKGIKVRAGEWDTQTQNERLPYQERNVVRKILHKDFISSNLYNNVALLILDRQFTKADHIGTVCLPSENQRLNSRECLATGWGKDIFGQQGRYAVILKKIQLPLVQNADCQRALRTTRLGDSFILHRTFICAGGEAGVDTCTGDGGSPLVCPDPNNPNRYVQAGIVSWGIGCGEDGIPGVYADITRFRNWIDLKLQELGLSTASYTN